MKTLLLLAILGVWGRATWAQYPVSGRVLNQQTHQPVPYASVVVAGTTQGTTTNADGEFALTLRLVPARLLAFGLGYGRDSVAVAAAGVLRPLQLPPVSIQLPGVEPPSYAATLLARAYTQLLHTRSQVQYGQAFYRQLTRNGDEPTEVLEAVWDVKTSPAGLEGSRLAQGRYGSVPAPMNFSNFSLFTKSAGAFCALALPDTASIYAVVRPGAEQEFVLQFKGLTQSNGCTVAEIAFANQPASKLRRVRGRIFIDVATCQVLHAQATREMMPTDENQKNFTFTENEATVEIDFRPQPTSAVLNYVRTSGSVLVQRPRKPALPMRIVAFAQCYDQSPVPTGLPYFGPDSPLSDLEAIRKKPYDAAFWRDNPVVKRTPLEESTLQAFEQKKAFGTLLTK